MVRFTVMLWVGSELLNCLMYKKEHNNTKQPSSGKDALLRSHHGPEMIVCGAVHFLDADIIDELQAAVSSSYHMQ